MSRISITIRQLTASWSIGVSSTSSERSCPCCACLRQLRSILHVVLWRSVWRRIRKTNINRRGSAHMRATAVVFMSVKLERRRSGTCTTDVSASGCQFDRGRTWCGQSTGPVKRVVCVWGTLRAEQVRWRHVEHEQDSNEETSARAQWELQNGRWALCNFRTGYHAAGRVIVNAVW
jgi:hypothetical protein